MEKLEILLNIPFLYKLPIITHLEKQIQICVTSFEMSTHFFPGPWREKSVWVFPFLWGEHQCGGGWRGSYWGQGPCCEVLNNQIFETIFLFIYGR